MHGNAILTEIYNQKPTTKHSIYHNSDYDYYCFVPILFCCSVVLLSEFRNKLWSFVAMSVGYWESHSTKQLYNKTTIQHEN